MSDIILDWMKEKGVPITRDNYLEIAYMGNPPEELSAEEEAELPDALQSKEAEEDEDDVPPANEAPKSEVNPKGYNFQDIVKQSYNTAGGSDDSDADKGKTGNAGTGAGEHQEGR